MPTISTKKLIALRKLTRSLSETLHAELLGTLITIEPLLRPRTVFGEHVQGHGKELVKGADKALKELQADFAAAVAAVSLWASGFAFHSGGVGLTSSLPGLQGLVWEWASPLKLDWGVLGLRGFFLLGDAATPAGLSLYLAILPSATVAIVLPMLTLRERVPGWMAALAGVFLGGLVFPMAGNWIKASCVPACNSNTSH